jgi:hypothetical protein
MTDIKIIQADYPIPLPQFLSLGLNELSYILNHVKKLQ